jgi:hypothetical protein
MIVSFIIIVPNQVKERYYEALNSNNIQEVEKG